MHQSLPYSSMFVPHANFSQKAHCAKILLVKIFTQTFRMRKFPDIWYAHFKRCVHTLNLSDVYTCSLQVRCMYTHIKWCVREKINSQVPHIGDTSLPLLKLKQLKSHVQLQQYHAGICNIYAQIHAIILASQRAEGWCIYVPRTAFILGLISTRSVYIIWSEHTYTLLKWALWNIHMLTSSGVYTFTSSTYNIYTQAALSYWYHYEWRDDASILVQHLFSEFGKLCVTTCDHMFIVVAQDWRQQNGEDRIQHTMAMLTYSILVNSVHTPHIEITALEPSPYCQTWIPARLYQ